jgi:hypothetical protein
MFVLAPNGSIEIWSLNFLIDGKIILIFQMEGVQISTLLMNNIKGPNKPQITTFQPCEMFHYWRVQIELENKSWTRSG